MKAMLLKQYGQDAKFEQSEIETTRAQAGEVLIRVASASVNTVDTMIKSMGKDLPLSPDLPAVLGMDFAGTVVSVGKNVTNFHVNDEVYGCVGGLADLQGTLAEYIAADANLIAHKPNNLSMRQAAALPLVGITAYEGLTRAGTKAGQKVLVHGGAGGVGNIAAQLACFFGAEVFTTVGREQHIALMKDLGTTPINYREQKVVDYVAQHTNGVGFDVVFDSVGGTNMLNSFEAAKLNGQIASTVSLLELDLTLAHFKGLSLHVVFMLIPMLHNVERETHGAILTELAKITEQEKLTPLLDETTFTFNETGAAYERLASGKATGKVVIDVTE